MALIAFVFFLQLCFIVFGHIFPSPHDSHSSFPIIYFTNPSVPKIDSNEALHPGHDPLLAVTPEKPFCHNFKAVHIAAYLAGGTMELKQGTVRELCPTFHS